MTSRMSARSLSLLALALSLGYVASADLHLLNIKQSRVYASSVASGSAPEYAVDQELNSTGPTCFQSLPGVYDASEYSWLVVDLGIITRNISELRIALNPDVQSNTTLSSVEVFVTKNMHTVVHYGNSADTRLPWSSYKFCGSTSSGHLTATSAEVQCKYPLDGRWIILRRKLEPLVICLLAVYVEKYQDECFKMVNSTSREHISGFQFRLERHISLEQCRDSCLETPICQAIVFTRKSRRIGICRHFRSFMDESSSYIECGSRCHLEENVCHRGRAFPLLPLESTSLANESIWEIARLQDAEKSKNLHIRFYAFRFKGRILCKARRCRNAQVLIVSSDNKETVCNVINTNQVSLLDRYTIYCADEEYALSDIKQVKIVPLSQENVSRGENPLLQIGSGYARIIVLNKQLYSDQTIPSIPDEPVATMAPGHHIPLAHAASQFEEISAITIPPTESPLHRHKTPSPDTDDHFLTTSDSTGSGPESESVTASSRMDEESVSYHTNTPPNSDIKLYTDSEPALTSFATSSGTPTPNIPGSLSRYHTDPSLTATLVQSDEDSSFREVNSPHRKGLLTFSENGTVTNSVLLTVTAGDLSATNLAMIIIIVSLISLVCIAVIVWFFCVHKN